MNQSTEKLATVTISGFDGPVSEVSKIKKSPKNSSITKNPKVMSIVNIRIRSVHVHRSPCFTKNQWIFIVISIFLLLVLVIVLISIKLKIINLRSDD